MTSVPAHFENNPDAFTTKPSACARPIGNCRGVPGLRLCGKHRHVRPWRRRRRQRQREGRRWEGGDGGRQDFLASVFRDGRERLLRCSAGRLEVEGRAYPTSFRKQRVRQATRQAGPRAVNLASCLCRRYFHQKSCASCLRLSRRSCACGRLSCSS